MAEVKEDRSLGQLFADLMQETRALLQQEVRLAKTEMSEKASRVGKDITSLVIGGAIAYAGLLAIVAAIIMGLARAVPDWVSALIVGLVIGGIGLVLIQQGRKQLTSADLAPRKTAESIQEDAQWAKEQMK